MCGTCWELVAAVWDFFITQVWKWFKKRCKGNWLVRALCKALKFIVALIITIFGFVTSVVLGIVCAVLCAFCFLLWFIVCVFDTIFDQQKCPNATDFCMEGVQVGTGSSGALPPTGTVSGGGVTGGGLAGGSTGWGSRKSAWQAVRPTNPSIVVTDVAQLRALSVWRGLVQGRPSSVVIQLSGMTSDLSRDWQGRINRHLSSCGCAEGATTLLIGCATYVLYLVAASPSSADATASWFSGWSAIAAGVVIACVAAALGKVIGLLRAQLLLGRARRHLMAALQRG